MKALVRKCPDCGKERLVKTSRADKRCAKCKAIKYNCNNNRYRALLLSSKRRNIECKITIEQYCEIIKNGLCFYCHSQIFTEKYLGCGIDRINNLLGYVPNNCLPCCSSCNMIKTGKISCFEMYIYIKVRKKLKSASNFNIDFFSESNKFNSRFDDFLNGLSFLQEDRKTRSKSFSIFIEQGHINKYLNYEE